MSSLRRRMLRKIYPFKKFEDKEERRVSFKGNVEKTKRLAKEKRRAHNKMAWIAKAKDRLAQKIRRRQSKKIKARGIKQ